MSAWKVLLIVALGCLCLGLVMATIAIPIAQDGGARWVWFGALLAATLCAGGLLGLFLRYAGHSLDLSPHKTRR
jgi:hypothetical protein